MIRAILRFFFGRRSLTGTYERRWCNIHRDKPGAF